MITGRFGKLGGRRLDTVLITGASAGIGLEFARLFAKDGYHLVISASNAERLEKTAERMREDYGAQVDVVLENLAVPGAAGRLVKKLNDRGLEINVLVNNAGVGVYGMFADTDAEKESQLLYVNIQSLTELTKLLLKPMLDRAEGKILNVGSTAGFVPGPGMAVYYASKAYVLSFSEALANELQGTGVSVTVLCPGPTSTEFQQRAGMGSNRLFNSVKPMSAARAAKKGYLAMLRGQAVVIPGLANKVAAAASRLVPRDLIPLVVRAINEPSP
jgi:short-subunit dehydrogenase